MKKTPAIFAGVFLLFFTILSAPLAHAVVPTPVASLNPIASKFSGSTWTNDGSFGSTVALYPASGGNLPTLSSADSAVALNVSGQNAQYIVGQTSSISGMTETTIELTMKIPSTQQYGTNSGVIFMWEGSAYTIWMQNNNCMGVNTGYTEIYGFNPSSLLGAFHTYTFVMSTFQDNTTKQRIYVDGVAQSLGMCLGNSGNVLQSNKAFGSTATYEIGIYKDRSAFPGSFSLRRAKIWLSDIGATSIQESYNSYIPPTSNALSLSSGLKTATYRTSSTLRSTVDAEGMVTFFSNGKKIAGCINIATVSKVASCTWKPALIGAVNLTSQLKAASGNLTSSVFQVLVSKRSGNR